MTLMDVKATKIFMPDNKNLTPYIMVNVSVIITKKFQFDVEDMRPKVLNCQFLRTATKMSNKRVKWYTCKERETAVIRSCNVTC